MATKMVNSQITTEEKPKKSIRSKKIEQKAIADQIVPSINASKVSPQPLAGVIDYFSELGVKIEQTKKEIINSQKEIVDAKEEWNKEKNEYEKGIVARNTEVALARKREEEEYEYQKKVERRKAEDEFAEKKTQWEKQLREEKEKIEIERKELVELRSKVASFENELQKAVKEAQSITTRDLEVKYAGERKLREQEVKSERDILALKIESLVAENNRQSAEIKTLKAAFDEATRQVKDIAVKVIEGRTPKILGSQEV